MKILTKDTAIESGCDYIAGCERFDIYPNDCTVTNEPAYRAPSTAAVNPLAVAFLLKDKHNVTLDFNGADIVFHGRITPFILDGCTNVTIKNCTINYDRPFYTEANILEADAKHLRLKIADGFPCRVEDSYLIAESEFWENRLNVNNLLFQLYDPSTHAAAPKEIILALIGRDIYPHPKLPLPIHKLTAEKDGEDVILRGDFPALWEAGFDLAITHESRDKNTFTALGCTNTEIQNVRIIHGASLGFVGMHSENITLDNFSMYRDDAHPRLVTNNADAVHCFNCKGEIKLINSCMDGMLDDSLNVHSNFTLAEKVDKNILYAYNASRDVCIDNLIYLPGDVIAVYRGATMEKKSEYTVKEVSTDGNETYILTLSESPEDIEKGDMIENLSGQADITVRHCTFGRFRGIMRLQSRGRIVIDDCAFENEGTNIAFTGDAVYWFESSPVQDVHISNCRFNGGITACPEVKATEKAPYYHSGINISGCSFAHSGIFSGGMTDGLSLSKNKCGEGEMYIRLNNCGSCETDGGYKIISR